MLHLRAFHLAESLPVVMLIVALYRDHRLPNMLLVPSLAMIFLEASSVSVPLGVHILRKSFKIVFFHAPTGVS